MDSDKLPLEDSSYDLLSRVDEYWHHYQWQIVARIYFPGWMNGDITTTGR